MIGVIPCFAAFVVGFASALYGASAGGGALLTVPALLFLGLPAVDAVATSRLGSLGVTLSGLVAFGRRGKIDWRLGLHMTAILSVGTVVGTYALLELPLWWVEKLVGVIILGVLALLLLFPRAGLSPEVIERGSWRTRVGYGLTLVLGVIMGFYQGGGGTMAAYIMVLFFGQTFLESAGTRKVPFLFSNLITIGMLIPSRTIHLWLGLSLGLGTLLGGYVGSQMALRLGNRWVRWVFIGIVGVSGLRMLFVSR